MLDWALGRLGYRPDQIATSGKSVAWKIAIAAMLKARPTVTNRWLARHLAMGNLYEVSRKVAAWSRRPDPILLRKLHLNPKPQATAP